MNALFFHVSRASRNLHRSYPFGAFILGKMINDLFSNCCRNLSQHLQTLTLTALVGDDGTPRLKKTAERSDNRE